MIKDFFKFSFISLKKRKLRSWLTIMGIVIGIAAVVALVSLSIGLNREIERQFQAFGSDKLFISSKGFGGGGFGPQAAGILLTEDDAETIRKVRDIDLVAPIYYQQLAVKFKDEVKYLNIVGIPTTSETKKLFEEVQGFKVEDGRQLKEDDKFKIAIGSSFTTGDVFENEISAGDNIEIGGHSFKVVGTYESIGNLQDDSQIIMPIDSLRVISNTEDEVSMILAKIKTGSNPTDVKADVMNDLRDAKGEKEDEESFQVNTSEDILRLINQLFGTIQVVLIGIGTISLIVGAVGVTNTMYTSVLERTKEIGIMKAIGAKNNDIMQIFLIESGILGFIGGLFGAFLGIGMAKAVETYASFSLAIPLKAYVGVDLVLAALLLSFVMGAAAGLFPARKASSLNPVDALRYE